MDVNSTQTCNQTTKDEGHMNLSVGSLDQKVFLFNDVGAQCQTKGHWYQHFLSRFSCLCKSTQVWEKWRTTSNFYVKQLCFSRSRKRHPPWCIYHDEGFALWYRIWYKDAFWKNVEFLMCWGERFIGKCNTVRGPAQGNNLNAFIGQHDHREPELMDWNQTEAICCRIPQFHLSVNWHQRSWCNSKVTSNKLRDPWGAWRFMRHILVYSH